jgi:hypothetical protein
MREGYLLHSGVPGMQPVTQTSRHLNPKPKEEEGMKTQEYQHNSGAEAEALERVAALLATPVKHDLDEIERAALDRLIAAALRGTGQSRIIANFLLSWWNSDECGAFDPTLLWGLDRDLTEDVRLVFRAIGDMAKYPDTLGYGKQFDRLVKMWRPQLHAIDSSEE